MKLSSKKIYLVRHGQTDFNLKSIVQGSGVNSSLNAYGVAQANAFYEAYKHIPFKRVYTSVLNRSIESVQKFLDMGIPHQRYEGLNEICWGTREGQVITPEEDAYYHYVLDQWRKGDTTLRIEGGESPDDVAERMRPVVREIMAQEHEDTILICMHGRAMRILLCVLMNYPLQCMDLFEHENMCLYLMDSTNGLFSIEAYNDTRHLAALKRSNLAVV